MSFDAASNARMSPFSPDERRVGHCRSTCPVGSLKGRYSLPGRMRYRRLPLKRPMRGVQGDDASFD